MSDFEKLINASDLIEWIMETYPDWRVGAVRSIVDHIDELPSAQPEYHLDEWCTDCKEYDHERHCCPRFNHMIRTTLQEVQAERKMGKWTINDCHAAVYKYHCSECGANHRARYDYCPSCGADMRDEQDG